MESCEILVSFVCGIRWCPILLLGVWFPFFPARFIGGGETVLSRVYVLSSFLVN